MHWTLILKDLIKENNYKGTWQEAIKELYLPYKKGGVKPILIKRPVANNGPITKKTYDAIVKLNMFLEIVRTLEESINNLPNGPLKKDLLKDMVFIERTIKKYFNKNINDMKGGSFTSKVSSIMKGLQSGARGIGHITRFLAYTLPHFVAKFVK